MEALRKFVSVRSAGSDNSLFMLSDKRTAALDQSLSELNLVSLLEGGDRCGLESYNSIIYNEPTQDQHGSGLEDHLRFPEGSVHNRA